MSNLNILQHHERFSTEKEYRAYPCVSYSILKDVYWIPELLEPSKQRHPSKYMNLGSAVDILLTSPEKKDEIIIVNSLPADSIQKMVKFLINDEKLDLIDDITDDQVIGAYNSIESKLNWGIPAKKANLLEKGREYFNIYNDIESGDVIIITEHMFNVANDIIMMLNTSPITKNIIHSFDKEDEYEVIYQYKFTYELYGVTIKSMIDLIVINHTKKTINLYDLKIGGYEETENTGTYTSFLRSFTRFKWMYQGCLYKTGFTKFVKTIFPDYLVENFKFLYVNAANLKYPYLYNMSMKYNSEILLDGIYDGYYELPSIKKVCKAVNYYLRTMETEGITVDKLLPYPIWHAGEAGIRISHSSINSYL